MKKFFRVTLLEIVSYWFLDLGYWLVEIGTDIDQKAEENRYEFYD